MRLVRRTSTACCSVRNIKELAGNKKARGSDGDLCGGEYFFIDINIIKKLAPKSITGSMCYYQKLLKSIFNQIMNGRLGVREKKGLF